MSVNYSTMLTDNSGSNLRLVADKIVFQNWGAAQSSNLSLSNILAENAHNTVMYMTDNQINVSADVIPTACNVYDLGSSNYRWKDLYLSGSTIDLGGVRIQKDTSTGGLQVVSQSDQPLDTRTNSLFASANVGIGTTDTSARLHVHHTGSGYAVRVDDAAAPDNSAFVVTDTGAVGIGSTVVNHQFQLATDNLFGIGLYQYNNSDGVAIRTYAARGTAAAPTALQTNNSLMGLRAFGHDGTSHSSTAIGSINIVAGNNFTPTSKPTCITLNTNPADAGEANAERMRIASDGNVGIGTTAPLAKTHILHTSTGDAFRVDDAATPDTTPFVINQDGNVGIGSSQPHHRFVVRDNVNDLVAAEVANPNAGASASAMMRLRNDAGVATIELDSSGAVGTGNDLIINNAVSGRVQLQVAGTSRLMIASNGNVGIGTTNPLEKFQVAGPVRHNSIALVNKTSFALSSGIGSTETYFQIATSIARFTARFLVEVVIAGSHTDLIVNINNMYSAGLANSTVSLQSGVYSTSQLKNFVHCVSTAETPYACQFFISATNTTGFAGTIVVTLLECSQPDLITLTGVQTALPNSGYNNYTYPVENTLQCIGNNGPKMVVTRSGSVGIGVTLPTHSFHVVGNGRFYGGLLVDAYQAVDSQGLWLGWNRDGGGGTSYYVNQKGGGTNGGHVWGESTTGNSITEYMRLSGDGKLGVGITPTGRFHAHSHVHSYIKLTSSGSDGAYPSDTCFEVLGNPAASYSTMVVKTNHSVQSDRYIFKCMRSSDEYLVVRGDGAVGVGTTNPMTKFHVGTGIGRFDNSMGTGLPVAGENGSTGTRLILWPGTGSEPAYSMGISAANMWRAVPTGATHTWYTSTSERMRIASDGKVGIGTTNVIDQLHVQGDAIVSSQFMKFYRTFNLLQHRSDLGYEFLLNRWDAENDTLFSNRDKVTFIRFPTINSKIYRVYHIQILTGAPNYYTMYMRAIDDGSKLDLGGAYNINITAHVYTSGLGETLSSQNIFATTLKSGTLPSDVYGYLPTNVMYANESYIYGSRFIARASSERTDGLAAYMAFADGLYWHSTDDAYNSSTYNYNGSAYLVPGYLGEWVTLQLPHEYVITSFTIVQSGLHAFRIYGSNDHTTWTQLYDRSTEYTSNTFTALTTTGRYLYYGIVINRQVPWHVDWERGYLTGFKLYGAFYNTVGLTKDLGVIGGHVLLHNGNVGIGTTNPVARLHLTAGSTVKGVTGLYKSGNINTTSTIIALDTTNFQGHRITCRFNCSVEHNVYVEYGINASTFMTIYESVLYRWNPNGANTLQQNNTSRPLAISVGNGGTDDRIELVISNCQTWRTPCMINAEYTYPMQGITRVFGSTQNKDQYQDYLVTHIKISIESSGGSNPGTSTISGNYFVEGLSTAI